MIKITDYTVASNKEYAVLAYEVNIYIQDGWQPLGG
jgi:hypothetical protein